MNVSETLPPAQVDTMDPSERHAKRIQMASLGARYLFGGIGAGVALLAAIGCLFPDWEVSTGVFRVCMGISLTVMACTAFGLWLLVKALFNMVE